jgi:transposase InsO family protein
MTEAERIAIFKYGIIAPVINDSSLKQKQYFEKAAELDYDYPGKFEKLNFKARTFKKWLHLYRKRGYEGLKPSIRADKGVSRKISESTGNCIVKLFEEYDFKTISNFYRHLVSENIISQESFTEVTLRNFMQANNISFDSQEKKPRKSFEAPHINILWTTDFMHGPYVREGNKKLKTYLCAIIDDYSRLITGGCFFLSEHSLSLQKTLMSAVLTYGVPNKLYCDNGKVFSSGYIHMVCSKLGTALIHSKPYDSPSRGKIERFFRTVRDMFIPNLYINHKDFTLEIINEEFLKWILNDYNKNIHGSIKDTPMNRYLADIPNVHIKKIDSSEADNYFHHTLFRTVKNDSTVTVDNILYEVPSKYIGKKIEIRFPLDKPDDLRIYENNSQCAVLTKLDKHCNSEMKIRYSKKEDDNV